jgi:acyl-ACP thioesterase
MWYFLSKFLETKAQFLKNSLSDLKISFILANYILSFINYILFIAHVTISYVSYEQVKRWVDMSFEFLKSDFFRK